MSTKLLDPWVGYTQSITQLGPEHVSVSLTLARKRGPLSITSTELAVAHLSPSIPQLGLVQLSVSTMDKMWLVFEYYCLNQLTFWDCWTFKVTFCPYINSLIQKGWINLRNVEFVLSCQFSQCWLLEPISNYKPTNYWLDNSTWVQTSADLSSCVLTIFSNQRPHQI